MHGVEIWYHPNAQNYWRFAGGFRYLILPRAGFTIAEQIASAINLGAIDRRPGAPNQAVGLDCLRAFEIMTVVDDVITA